jgi:hypothetical protein
MNRYAARRVELTPNVVATTNVRRAFFFGRL